jgi:thiosulfate dehydrogenase (quinone) large subunit
MPIALNPLDSKEVGLGRRCSYLETLAPNPYFGRGIGGLCLQSLAGWNKCLGMLLAYLESIKYVGHMWPLALIRLVIGYQYISMVVSRIQNGYLDHAYITERLDLSEAYVSGFYFEIFKSLVQSQWLLMTYVLIIFELLIGLSYVLGFMVRLSAVMGIFLTLHLYLFFDFTGSPGQIYMLYIHLLFLLLGAGRCLGLDYYFYKSRRGLLW